MHAQRENLVPLNQYEMGHCFRKFVELCRKFSECNELDNFTNELISFSDPDSLGLNGKC